MVFMVLEWAAPHNRAGAFRGYAIYVCVLVCVCLRVLPKTAKFSLPRRERQSEVETEEEEENMTVKARAKVTQELDKDSTMLTGATATTGESRARTVSVGRLEGIDNGTDKWDQLWSTEYRALLLWFCCVMPAVQFYVLSVGYQLELWGDTDGTYSRVFIWAQGGFALLSPLSGRLADWAGLGCAQALATVLVAISYIMLALPRATEGGSDGMGGLHVHVQVVGIVCYAVGRGLTFGMYFSNVGRRFGYTHYGLLAGLGLILSALVSLLQYPLLWWCVAGGDRGANVVCCLSCLATLPYAFWLRRREQRESRTAGAVTAISTDAAGFEMERSDTGGDGGVGARVQL